MNPNLLDVVVLERDLLRAYGLRRGDLGAVVEIHENGALMVEFVAASGRTQALVTLVPADVRAVADDDLVSVASRRHARARQGPERLRPTH